MHRKPVFPAFAAAFAALVSGCEWTGTSSSDSWSGSYDAMNFSGSYRSSIAQVGGTTTTTTSTDSTSSGTSESGETLSARETVGSYVNDVKKYSGQLSHSPVVLSSVQIQLGGITFTGDGSGNLVSDYGSGKVTTSGAWSVDLDATPTTTTGGHEKKVTGEVVGSVSADDKFNGNLKKTPIVQGSVVVTTENGLTFTDNGSGGLSGSVSGAGGSVEYTAGSVSIQWTSAYSYVPYTGKVKASYSYYDNTTQKTGVDSLGSGSIVASYQYTTTSSSSSSTTTTTTSTSGSYPIATRDSAISSITVSQSGQNLVMTTNTGVQMSGKFTAVRETSGSDTAAVKTYNAQFQVSSASGHKFVGTLNYDLPTSRRTLNGTLTSGGAVYDVQGVGPAFSTSAN